MNIYPKPGNIIIKNGSFVCKNGVRIAENKAAPAAARLLQKRLGLFCNLTASIHQNGDIRFEKIAGEGEAYQIEVKQNEIIISAADAAGMCHGAETLAQLFAKKQEIPCMILTDAPYKQYRGVHLYMPGAAYIEECKRLLDVLSFLKFNTVILEVGGTMELEKHPEVNRAWVNFCKIAVEKFPGGPQNLQWSERYWKDSTHYENARGEILTKAQVRDLVQYAKALELKVIPEIQALSHCYYLTMAHPEIAEDRNDFFPDTYCPLNENSYKLYFDVATEIIEVFEPEIVSIGHDEIRIMGECPRCREKTGAELLSYEINKLHAFYKEKNIRIMMWCEKLLPPMEVNGNTWGGGEDSHVDEWGREWKLPSMYEAIHMLPKDIIMLDWYHGRDAHTSKYFNEQGFAVMYGNFSGLTFLDWDSRSSAMMGGEISTWCTPDEFTLGRNGVLFDLIFTANMMWRSDYADDKYEGIRAEAMAMVEPVRALMRGKNAPDGDVELLYRPKDGQYAIQAKKAKTYGKNAALLLSKSGDLCGTEADTAHILIRNSFYAKSLLLCEGFKKAEDFFMSYSFINTPYWEASPSSRVDYLCVNMPRWSGATHEILYEDNTVELINAVYGITAADVHMVNTRERLLSDDQVAEMDAMGEGGKAEKIALPQYKYDDDWINSVAYFSDAIISDAATAYVYEWENPHPDKKITAIKVVSTTHDIDQSAIVFAIGYKK
ncbi:MAG: family 20 glycosylhydrolase [Clostridia bacterium]|nr:family 20 glycosylhydrolase [Clostridia bacterium]